MSRSKLLYGLLCLILLGGIVSGLADTKSAQAQPAEKLTLSARYPSLSAISGSTFTYDVELKWEGSSARKFDLAITQTPPRWQTAIVETTGAKQITAITLEPGATFPETIGVAFAPLANEVPEPGNYVAVLEASSGNIRERLELTAVVTAKYLFAFYTESELLSTEAVAGKETQLNLIIANTGTAKIEDITLNSSKPFGWTITFNPEEIASIEPGIQKTVYCTIKPANKTIAGDYNITLQAIVSKGLIPTRELQIRTSVLTPTIWGWVGILIVLAVIAGLGIMFRILGRR